jgi:thiamine-monophosphate kinase
MLNERTLIERFFVPAGQRRRDVITGIGDDGAITRMLSSHDLVTSTDTLVSGVHFFPDTPAYDIGYKSLAVNLSDLAAMGATPMWATLAITLPTVDEHWLQDFASGFGYLAQQYSLALIGGDTTRGPLSITITIFGWVPQNSGLRRSGAKVDDLIFVTDTVGDAGLALSLLQHNQLGFHPHHVHLQQKLQRPEPQVAAGLLLLDMAHSAIDISDGLAADLNHILTASQVGATLDAMAIPLSPALLHDMSRVEALRFALFSGDDYGLCFTLPSHQKDALLQTGIKATQIGMIEDTRGLRLKHEDGRIEPCPIKGWDPFTA